MLNTSLVDRSSSLAFGCLGLALGGAASLPVTAMALGTLGALAFAARAKHGTDSRAVIRRIARQLRNVRRKDQQYGYAEQAELDRIAKAFVKASDGAMLSAEDLAALSVKPDMSGFPEAASDIILTAIGKADPQFKADGLAREFAQDALAEALRAAIEDADYFKKLEPHLLIRTAESMGTVLAFLERMEADAIRKGRQLDEMQDTLERFADARLPPELIIALTRKADDTVGDTAEALVSNLLGRLEAAEALIEEGRTPSNLPQFVDAVETRVAEQVKAGDFAAADRIATDAVAQWEGQQAEQIATGLALIDTEIRTARLNADDIQSAATRIAELECKTLRLEQGHLFTDGSAHCLDRYRESIEHRADALDVQIAIALIGSLVPEAEHHRVTAATHNACGSLHTRLGGLGMADHLSLAITAYERALEEWTQDRVPLKWATTQNNLGSAYQEQARRGDAEALTHAITAYERALEEWTQDRVPLKWAATQNNLGNAYQEQARRGDANALAHAITAYERALEERTQDRVPLDWAMTQNNLGSAYQEQARRGDAEALTHAITAYERALEEWTQDRVPLKWAATQNNLGNAYMEQAERGDMEALTHAITAYERALEERTQDRVPLDWAATQIGLSNLEGFRARSDHDGAALRSAMQRQAEARQVCLDHGHHAYAEICAYNIAIDQTWLDENFPDTD